jgi:hypothetical protein
VLHRPWQAPQEGAQAGAGPRQGERWPQKAFPGRAAAACAARVEPRARVPPYLGSRRELPRCRAKVHPQHRRRVPRQRPAASAAALAAAAEAREVKRVAAAVARAHKRGRRAAAQRPHHHGLRRRRRGHGHGERRFRARHLRLEERLERNSLGAGRRRADDASSRGWLLLVVLLLRGHRCRGLPDGGYAPAPQVAVVPDAQQDRRWRACAQGRRSRVVSGHAQRPPQQTGRQQRRWVGP